MKPEYEGRDRAPIGVLWTNLGSPAAPEPGAVRTYLRQFLTDPRVVDLNPVLWRLLLELVILPRRGRTSAHAYSTVWTADGSPLVANSRRQTAALARELGPDYRVATAMRYGEPSIASAVEELLGAGCERLVMLPAFPQYASATTGSAVAETFRVLGARRVIPPLSVVPPYPADPDYVAALAAGARAAASGRTIDHWVFSFHGIPVRYAEAGDRYPADCGRTAQALAHALGLGPAGWTATWQSRFGREPWLEPATDTWVIANAKRHGTLGIVVPGFTADCLETLEEIGERLRADVAAAGAPDFVLVPALNDSAQLVRGLARLIRTHAGASGLGSGG